MRWWKTWIWSLFRQVCLGEGKGDLKPGRWRVIILIFLARPHVPMYVWSHCRWKTKCWALLQWNILTVMNFVVTNSTSCRWKLWRGCWWEHTCWPSGWDHNVSIEEEGWVICHLVLGVIRLVADTGWLASAWSRISWWIMKWMSTELYNCTGLSLTSRHLEISRLKVKQYRFCVYATTPVIWDNTALGDQTSPSASYEDDHYYKSS